MTYAEEKGIQEQGARCGVQVRRAGRLDYKGRIDGKEE